ncbi:MAG: hypothetical protein LUG57_03090 [Oscillospiraceae bacterium]|nr:hypothetical protein [Oscillospiraceae bacterium]
MSRRIGPRSDARVTVRKSARLSAAISTCREARFAFSSSSWPIYWAQTMVPPAPRAEKK